MLFADAELLLGADHRIRLDAADLGALERGQHQAIGMTVINRRAFLGISHLDRLGQFALALELEQVGRARQDGVLLRAIEQVAQRQSVRVGMRPHLADLRHDDLLAIPFNAARLELVSLTGVHVLCISRGHRPSYIVNFLHFESTEGERARDVFDGQAVNVHVIFEPGER